MTTASTSKPLSRARLARPTEPSQTRAEQRAKQSRPPSSQDQRACRSFKTVFLYAQKLSRLTPPIRQTGPAPANDWSLYARASLARTATQHDATSISHAPATLRHPRLESGAGLETSLSREGPRVVITGHLVARGRTYRSVAGGQPCACTDRRGLALRHDGLRCDRLGRHVLQCPLT